MSHAIVFGGTFDPVHNGHVAVASQVRERTGADAVWVIPAATPPLRPAPGAPAAQRLRLLHAVFDPMPGFGVSGVEVERDGISYTADTMDELRRAHPDADMRLLLGADSARTIGRWHRSGELLASARFVIVNRTGEEPLSAADAWSLGYAPARTTMIEVESPHISAGDVRRRVQRGEPIDHLVPLQVAALIAELGLYRSAPSHA